jgi:serine/threonine-protein kinase
VAVKVLHAELSRDAEVRRRFLREGYAANVIDHSGVVRVLDDDVTEDGAAFLVMELVEGETLDARCARLSHRLPHAEVVAIARAVLDVLSAAHMNGVVHRDIKPENVFLTLDGAVKVLDFGIAQVRRAPGGSFATMAGATFGTPAFMSPEQALGRSQEVDGRSDVWAVGATIFWALSGRAVHEGTTINEVLVAAATQPAAPLATVVPGVSAELATVVDRALARDRAARWQDAGAMRDALGRASLERSPREMSCSGSRPAGPPHLQASLGAPGTTPWRPERASRARTASVVGAMFLVVAAGVALVRALGGPPAPAASPALGVPSALGVPPAPTPPAPWSVTSPASPAAEPLVPGAPSVASSLPPSSPPVAALPARPLKGPPVPKPSARNIPFPPAAAPSSWLEQR